MTVQESYFFHAPAREVGGTQEAFLQVTRALVAEGAHVHFADFADGRASRTLADVEGVTLHPMREGVPVRVPAGSRLVLTASHAAKVGRAIVADPDTPVLLWTMHPRNLLAAAHPLWPFMQRLRDDQLQLVCRGLQPRGHRVRRWIEALDAREGIACMVASDQAWTRRITGATVRGPLLPIPVRDPAQPPRVERSWDGTRPLRVAWIGRFARDKAGGLVSIARDVWRWSLAHHPVELTLIGYGTQQEAIARALDRDRVEVRFAGVQEGAALDDLLRAQDVVIAMGISALEAAKLGVPVILVPLAETPLPPGQAPALWLHEAPGHAVGGTVPEMRAMPGVTDAGALMTAFVLDAEGALPHRSLTVHTEHHRASAVAERLRLLSRRSRAVVADLTEHRAIRPMWAERALLSGAHGARALFGRVAAARS